MHSFFSLAVVLFCAHFPVFSFATESIPPSTRAISMGCGNKIYTPDDGNHKAALEELKECYETSMTETLREHLTPVGMAVKICSSFSLDIQQYFCIEKYKEEAHEPTLYKLFNECFNFETNLKEKSKLTYACIKEKLKNEKAFPLNTKEEVLLEKPQLEMISRVKDLCGSESTVSGFSNEEVDRVAECYRTALLFIKKPKLTAIDMTLKLCEVLPDRLNRLACYRRGVATIKNPKLETVISTCLAKDKNRKKLTKAEAFRKIKYKVGGGYELAQKEYSIKTDCIHDGFVSVNQEETPVKQSKPAEPSQAKR